MRAFASIWWPIAHLAGAGVFVFLVLRTVVLWRARPGSRGAMMSAVLTGIGAFGVVLYYGMEAFALHGLAVVAAGQDPATVLATADALRLNNMALTVFGAGLLLVTLGVALSSARGGVRGTGWRHWVLVVAVAGILPHFFLPPGGRVVFGVVFLAACLLQVATSGHRSR
ncbi:hypothetical protein [Kocuria himachalensis]